MGYKNNEVIEHLDELIELSSYVDYTRRRTKKEIKKSIKRLKELKNEILNGEIDFEE